MSDCPKSFLAWWIKLSHLERKLTGHYLRFIMRVFTFWGILIGLYIKTFTLWRDSFFIYAFLFRSVINIDRLIRMPQLRKKLSLDISLATPIKTYFVHLITKYVFWSCATWGCRCLKYCWDMNFHQFRESDSLSQIWSSAKFIEH